MLLWSREPRTKEGLERTRKCPRFRTFSRCFPSLLLLLNPSLRRRFSVDDHSARENDDPRVRRNRLGLLRVIRDEMNRVADLSRLAA